MNLEKLFSSPQINQVIFYPRKSRKPNKNTINAKYLEFSMDDGHKIGAILYHQEKSLPTIVFFHGNGEIASDYHDFTQPFFNCGVNLLVCDFRGYGFSTGHPTYLKLLEDALPTFFAAQSWLDRENYNRKLVVMGRSLGSSCASMIAGHNPIGLYGVIFESGFADTFRLMHELFRLNLPDLPQDFMDKYTNKTKIQNIKIPTLVIHGSNDFIVPYYQGEAIYSNLSDDIWKKMITIQGAGHNNIQLFQKEYFAAIQDFLVYSLQRNA